MLVSIDSTLEKFHARSHGRTSAPSRHEYTREMSFPWLDCTPPREDGSARRTKVAADELASHAALFYRLGFSEAAATSRLTANVAWEYDTRAPLTDDAIAKIVADTYARRPA